MLEKVSKRYAGLPIHIFLDNARYQHCTLVCETAQKLNITIEFLPPYPPSLNLIEHFWKLVKKRPWSHGISLTRNPSRRPSWVF